MKIWLDDQLDDPETPVLDEEMKIAKSSKRGWGSKVYYIYSPDGKLGDHLDY